ncbi:glycoside hydrolase family 15 protein [Candidatus Woesearchaeota archaeon]|nr:glycoside hydrolase family 15 protein [Candidatus Woesearchaeota archaeon]
MSVVKSVNILKSMRHPNGLFSASNLKVSTGYDRAWIRDNVYEAIGLEAVDVESAVKTYQALLDILLKHEEKIDWAIRNKPTERYQYIHARYDPESLSEIHEEWGNKQNDAVGLLLFKICELSNKGMDIIRDRHDLRIIQKLVDYLESIEYWHDCDNGMWEENEEVHASSVGACAAGLRELKKTIFKIPALEGRELSRKVFVPVDLIKKGENTLKELLPRESTTKDVDMALLSLIYPLNVVSKTMAMQIVKNVEERLLRENGVIRYAGDIYYSNGKEAEWTMGIVWLAIIHKLLGNKWDYNYYKIKTTDIMNSKGELPELYFGGTNEHNENSPLGWSQALYLVMEKM